MKNVLQKIITFSFVVFLGGTMILSLIFGPQEALISLSKNKKDLLNYSFTPAYFKTVTAAAGDACTSGVFLRARFIDLYGALQKAMGKSIIWESDPDKTIMIGSDGKLYPHGNITMSDFDYTVEKKDFGVYAKQLCDLGAFVKSEGAELVFFQAPARYNPDRVSLPVPVSDTGREDVDSMYDELKADDNVIVLNSQILYKKAGMSFDDLFFKTDHHWNIRTAFWAFGEICGALNEKGFGIDKAFYDPENYETETVKNSFLGSYGVKTGGPFAGYDDFDLIYPKFETDYVTTICKDPYQSIGTGGKTESRGDFTQAIIASFDGMKNRKTKIIYGNYISSDRCEIIIRNSKAATDKKALILKDSYGIPVSAFLSTCFEEVVILDPRYYTERTICDYISDYKPDAVILIYAPGDYYSVFFDFGIPEWTKAAAGVRG